MLRLPGWLAPNLITLIGTLWLVAAYLLAAYFTPDFSGGLAHKRAQQARYTASPAVQHTHAAMHGCRNSWCLRLRCLWTALLVASTTPATWALRLVGLFHFHAAVAPPPRHCSRVYISLNASLPDFFLPSCPALPTGDAPSWVPLFSAAAVVVYTWLDCLDGKQARRTGTSSPLGQLFDHGCDALSVNLLLANIACSLSIPCGWAHALGNLGVSDRTHGTEGDTTLACSLGRP